MTQKNGLSLTDPIGNLRSLRDTTMDAWAKAMIDAVNTESFARALGAYLDAYLGASAPIQRAVDQYMKAALPRFGLPTRDDITGLARRMTTIELRLDDMEVKLEQVAHAVRSQVPIIVEMLEEEMGQSREVGAQEQSELNELEDRLKSLDAKTDRLLHLLERLQAPPPTPRPATRSRKKPAEPPPPTAEEEKEDKAIEGF